MPLAAENFVQENWGTANPGGTTSIVIPLTGGNNPSGVGTTAGNTVIVFLTSPGSGITPPVGWTTDKEHTGVLYAYRGSNIAAGETSWTFTLAVASSVDQSFYVVELSGVDPVEPLEASALNTQPSIADGGTLSTGTTPLNAALNTLALSVFAADTAVAPTWSGYTNDFEEVQEVTTGSPTRRIAVARKFVTGTTGQFTTTATLDTSGASTTPHALIVVYRAADSPIVAPLAGMAGFEQGTHGGATAATGPNSLFGSNLAPVGTWGTTYLVQASSARTSGYGLRIVRSAATGAVRIGNFSSRTFTAGMNVRVVSGSGVATVASGVASNGINTFAPLRYDFSTNKFGVMYGGATSWQAGTTPLNTWVWVEWRHSPALGVTDWRLETGTDIYEDQTAATGTATTGTAMVSLQLGAGSGTSDTATIDYDDVVISPFYSAYPLGPHQVRILVPDTAATVTYSGTPGNFAIVASNATSTALAGSGGDITTTGVAGRLDEVPPTISSAADGVVQTATAASDYLQFPMSSPTVADDEVIDGVRMLAALISTTGAGSGNLAIRGWDGSAETALASVTAVTPSNPTATSTTAPYWLTAIWSMANGWTVTQLTAAALRIGFSGDATPDMGAHVLYLEYATKKAREEPLFGESNAELRVEADTNPFTYGIRALRAYTPANQSATLIYEVDGVEQSPVAVAAGSDPQVVVLDAPDMVTVNRITMIPDEPT